MGGDDHIRARRCPRGIHRDRALPQTILSTSRIRRCKCLACSRCYYGRRRRGPWSCLEPRQSLRLSSSPRVQQAGHAYCRSQRTAHPSNFGTPPRFLARLGRVQRCVCVFPEQAPWTLRLLRGISHTTKLTSSCHSTAYSQYVWQRHWISPLAYL